jgi:hypothetical protein
MTIDPQLRSQLAQTIYVAAPSTVDSYGQVTYATPVAVKARVELQRSTESGGRGGAIDNQDGEQSASSTLVITETEIKPESRIWLPGDNQADPTLARRPLSVLRLPDERGNLDHYETRV